MKKVLITGSAGRIGTVLRDEQHGLKNVAITEFDLPDHDARDRKQMVAAYQGHDMVVHLAWNTRKENSRSTDCHIDNFVITRNAYHAALETGVRRLIVASSVHVDTFQGNHPHPTHHSTDLPTPDSPYGAHKGFMEYLGSYYASKKAFEVVAIRFGTVCRDGESPKPGEERVWLSNRDCVSLVQTCIDADDVPPSGYCIINGVSNNSGRQHYTENALGWEAQDTRQP